MAGTLKPVRIKLAWQTYAVGEVITPNGTLRDWLLANGYAELLPTKVAPVRDRALTAEQAKGGLFNR